MPISRKEAWTQIAELDADDHICFTEDFRALMGNLGWEAKALCSTVGSLDSMILIAPAGAEIATSTSSNANLIYECFTRDPLYLLTLHE